MRLIVWLMATILSAILYRMGGSSNWNSKWRDVGCPLIGLFALCLTMGFKVPFWWVYLVTFGLSWVALSTYWDTLFGYDNYYAHGLGCGLAAFFLCLVIPWWILVIRLVVCSVGMGLWSKLIKRDVPQELGRGALFII